MPDTAPPPAAGPTTFQKIRGLPWSLTFNILNTVFVQFTFFGSAFVLFLDQLGLDKTQIGFVLALLPFFDLVSLVVANWASRFGYKRTFLTFWLLRTFFSAFLLLVPLALQRFGAQAVLGIIAAIVIAFALSRSIAITALMPWQQEYIPHPMWGKYSATNTIFTSLSGVAAVSAAGFVLNRTSGLDGFMFLFGTALAFGVAAAWAASRIPGGAPAPATPKAAKRKGRKPSSGLRATLRDRDFLAYLIGAGLISLATVPLGGFIPLFMQDVIGLNAGSVVLLQTGGLIGGVLSGYLWGWAADRYGSRPVTLTGVFFIVVLPLLWLVMPRGSEWSFPAALGIAFLRGALINAWGIGSGRLLYTSVVPVERKVAYMAVYGAWMGIASGISQLAGGRLLDLAENFQAHLWGFEVDAYSLLFAVSMALAALSALFLGAIRAGDERLSVGKFAGMFFHGNPFLAMESMVRYHFARDESSVVNMTERLGRAQSPLTVEELLQALDDPRFYVRFEAIVSIARREPDVRLLGALSELLQGQDPSLSVIAAWALGRLNDPRAVEPLRQGLDSPYRSIRAHAARSLGSLEDRESAAVLLERIKNEGDHGLQVAYAAALGRLGTLEAAPVLLELLAAEAERDARAELALALGRLAGDENQFIQLWRRLEADPGTALSQALAGFKRSLPGELEEQAVAAERAIELFARQELEPGAVELAEMLRMLPLEEWPEPARQILGCCAGALAKPGVPRTDFLVLCMHTLGQGG